jgi:hypothetical protein
MYKRPTQIGTLTVPEGMSKTKSDYECAAWWTQVRLTPGTVPLVATFYDWNAEAGCMAAMVGAEFPGHIEDEYMPAMFAGVANPGGPRCDLARIGQPFTLHVQTYAFDTGAGLITGELWGCKIELLPGVKIESFEIVTPGHTSGSERMPIVVPEHRHTSYRVFVGPKLPLFLSDTQRAHLAHVAKQHQRNGGRELISWRTSDGIEIRPWVLDQLRTLGLIRSHNCGPATYGHASYYCSEEGMAYVQANGLLAPTAA